ncbi:MAG TPA: S-methyl-5-thioribose-1-phosphate isomerase [Candidatus Brocadiia bacterium]|nr:S-methyl-5-thioribose-1-phosphate isomerase [Candidatus Brocadiia bacterium]
MPVETINWDGGLPGKVRMVAQKDLPINFREMTCGDVKSLWNAIKTLQVRGAPALGIAGAFGIVLGVQDSSARDFDDFLRELDETKNYLATSRPTAVNLFWGMDRMKRVALENRELPIPLLKTRLLHEARKIREEDMEICRRIGRNGAALVSDGMGLLTHCNAGGLATADYGTALAVMFAAKEQGKRFHVFMDETRPLLQGARLTAWELQRAGIDCTLICDNMAAQVMKEGRVQMAVVGADRIAANGDTANKVGTYGLSVIAKAHGVKFYIAAPVSTFDLTLPDGSGIPIEERAAEEITEGFGTRTAPEGVKVYNPAFDVSPAENITGIITEHGVIMRPNTRRVAEHMKGA